MFPEPVIDRILSHPSMGGRLNERRLMRGCLRDGYRDVAVILEDLAVRTDRVVSVVPIARLIRSTDETATGGQRGRVSWLRPG